MSDAALHLDALQRAVDGLRSQQESVRRERAELQSMKPVVDANLGRFKQRVKLNVGGSKFETTLSTLTRYPDSMLGAMFSGRHEVPPDDEGYVFIDRDGTHFRAILNFLRTGFVDQPRSEQAANERFLGVRQPNAPGAPTAFEHDPAKVVARLREAMGGGERAGEKAARNATE